MNNPDTPRNQSEMLVLALLDYYHDEASNIQDLECHWDDKLIVRSRKGNIPLTNLLKQSSYASEFQADCSQKVSDLLAYMRKRGIVEKRSPKSTSSRSGPPTSPIVYAFNLPSENKDECLKALRAGTGKPVGRNKVRDSSVGSYSTDSQTPAVDSSELVQPLAFLGTDTQFYVERPPSESICKEVITQPGALLRVKSPKHMGKTSLLFYLCDYAERKDYRTVYLNLAAADQGVLSELDRFLKWFCQEIANDLSLEEAVQEEWKNEQFSSSIRCSRCFDKHFLKQQETPLLLAIDEVDQLFPYQTWADDFFKLLRAWHDKSKSGSKTLWQRLRVALTYATEDYVPLNIRTSPFNVGVCITLEDFESRQINELAQSYGLGWTHEQIQALTSLVGGHPYLIHAAAHCVATGHQTLDDILDAAPTASGIYQDHLYELCDVLNEFPSLKSAFQRVILSDSWVDLDVTELNQLRRLGLIRQSQNQAKPRNTLYRRYFTRHLR